MNKQFFGIDCLGCGMQRALMLVLNGEFKAAFVMFPAIYTSILLLFFIFLLLVDKEQKLFKRKFKYHKIVILLVILNTIIMIISYINKFFIK